MNKKTLVWFVMGLVLVAILSYTFKVGIFRNGQNQQPTASNSNLKVVGTFYPLAHFALAVGGNYVDVSNITPAGAEPHDYEPTPQDIIKAYNAKVFIMNGGGIDTWAEKIISDLSSKGVMVVDIQDSVQLEAAPIGTETPLDTHIWLDPVLAQQEVQLIRDAFMKADPIHAEAYDKNAADYIAQLQSLDKDFRTGLMSCKLKDIVTSHAAFGYMAKRYGLNQIAISGLSPGAEPSPQTLASIVQIARQKQIKYIFFETLVSPKLSQTIANEVGSQTIAFNPLEGLTDSEIAAGKTYLTEMRTNLDALRTALQCK
jgi:zinc transport system substrate-binding protein